MKHKISRDAIYWREQIRLATAHAEGIRDYCDKNSIQRQAFYYWKKRLNGLGAVRRGPVKRAFARVEIVGPASADRPRSAFESLPDPKWLAEFLLALSGGGAR